MISLSGLYKISISADPIKNMMYSLILIEKSQYVSGMNHWPTDIFNLLTDEERKTHRLVVEGFPLFSENSFSSFNSYLEWIEEADPDTFVRGYVEDLAYICLDPELSLAKFLNSDGRVDITKVMESRESYIEYLGSICDGEEGEGSIDLEFEKSVYDYLISPEKMQKIAVKHLRMLWDKYLAQEWVRVEKIVLDTVNALNQLDFSLMDIRETIKHITDKDPEKVFKKHTLDRMKRINRFVFVPSPHVGPYMSKYIKKDVMWIFFGARIPKGVNFSAPLIDHQEIVSRLSAIADTTRLKILKHIATVGERSSTQIMNDLNLSQSATSRHLKQLSANGILVEGRDKRGKYYSLCGERVKGIFKSVTSYLLIDS